MLTAISVAALPLVSCSAPAVPSVEDVAGTWMGFDASPIPTIDLLEDGSCAVTELPSDLVSGVVNAESTISGGCVWRIGSASGETRDDDGIPFLTLDLDAGGRLVLAVLRGPRLSVRVGDDDEHFDFDRAEA